MGWGMGARTRKSDFEGYLRILISHRSDKIQKSRIENGESHQYDQFIPKRSVIIRDQ